MPLSGTIWSDGLGDPESGPGKEFERLRGRRVVVRAELREAGLAEQAAAEKLAAAQRANRLLRAEQRAMGNRLATAAAASALVAAADGAERAAARTRDLVDALGWIDRQAEELVQHHAGELLAEVGAGAENAQQATLEALGRARQALAAWSVAARRQEALLSAAGGAFRDVRAPYEKLKNASEALAALEAGLPDAAVGQEVAANGYGSGLHQREREQKAVI